MTQYMYFGSKILKIKPITKSKQLCTLKQLHYFYTEPESTVSLTTSTQMNGQVISSLPTTAAASLSILLINKTNLLLGGQEYSNNKGAHCFRKPIFKWRVKSCLY